MVKRKSHFNSSQSSGQEMSEESDWDAEIYDLPKKPSKSKLNKSMTSFSEQSNSENEFKHASSDSSHEAFNDGYGSDFMGDFEDRDNLARMTEKEREQEIFKRIENRDVLKTRFNIEKKLRQAKRREMKKLKTIQDEKVERYFNAKERDRRAEENRDSKKFQSSSSSRKRHDSQRSKQRTENQMRHSKTKLKASEIYSDDSGSSSEDERATKSKSKSKSKKKMFSSSDSSSDSDVGSRVRSSKAPAISSQNQLNQIRLSRCKLEQFLQIPFFKRVVTGCFVRLVIGTANNKPIYKICEVIDVNEDSSFYQLGSLKTNKILRLKYGPHERDIRLQFVSNHEFSEAEFQKWQKVCSVQGILLPKVDQIQSKLRDIKEAILYNLKEDDIERIMRRKERFRINPHNYAVKKNQLLKDREIAQSIGDIAKADDIQDELTELENKALQVEKLRTTTVSNINYINNRNRKKYTEESEKIAAELRMNKDQKVDDPFTRRHTKPTMKN
ncbi:RNA polymerase-associated protein RTF1 homolog [Planococcus citri]|uniref:RNA polymerase-associated protein RTF1 homolog n=1 Tax=Planococcus citri TaxID=170843 RepID=UPI0031F9DF41